MSLQWLKAAWLSDYMVWIISDTFHIVKTYFSQRAVAKEIRSHSQTIFWEWFQDFTGNDIISWTFNLDPD